MEILVSKKNVHGFFFFFFFAELYEFCGRSVCKLFLFFSGTGKIVGKNENQAKSFKFIIIFIPLSLIMQ